MTQLINTIGDFNQENFKKIKTLIDSGNIRDIESLDKIINPDFINKNNNGIKINELSVYSDEFKLYKKTTTNELNKLLNDILPKVCEIQDKKQTDIGHANFDDIIGLLENKINLITEMMINN
jgi:hypothetical protein